MNTPAPQPQSASPVSLPAVTSAGSGLRRRLLREGTIVVAAKAASAVAMLAVAGLVARILPIEAVGSYFLAYSFVAVLGFTLTLGLSDLGLRLVARATLLERAGHVAPVVRRVLAVALIALSAAVAVGLAGAAIAGGLGLLPGDLGVLATALTVIWGAVLAYRMVVSGILRAIGRVLFSNVCANLAASVLTASLLGAWWLAGLPGRLDWVIAISVVAAMASTVLATALLRHFVAEPIWTHRVECPGELLRDGLPIAAANLLSSVVLQGPLWVVAALGGTAEAALFGAGVRVAQSLGAAEVVSILIGAPHMVTLEARGETRRLARMSQALSLVGLAPPLIMLAALLLLGRKFMALVFGSAFVASAAPLVILTAGRALQMACGNGRTLLLMTGHQRALLRVDAMTSIAVMLTSAAGYGLMGINGAAAGASLGMVGGAFATAALARRSLGFWPLSLTGVSDFMKRNLLPRTRPSGP